MNTYRNDQEWIQLDVPENSEYDQDTTDKPMSLGGGGGGVLSFFFDIRRIGFSICCSPPNPSLI